MVHIRYIYQHTYTCNITILNSSVTLVLWLQYHRQGSLKKSFHNMCKAAAFPFDLFHCVEMGFIVLSSKKTQGIGWWWRWFLSLFLFLNNGLTTMTSNLQQSIQPSYGSKYYYKLIPTLHTNSNVEYDDMWPCRVLSLHGLDFVTSLALSIATKEVLLTWEHICSPQLVNQKWRHSTDSNWTIAPNTSRTQR